MLLTIQLFSLVRGFVFLYFWVSKLAFEVTNSLMVKHLMDKQEELHNKYGVAIHIRFHIINLYQKALQTN